MLSTDLIKLNNLQLAGKLVSEELLLGIQTSRRTGVGTEFEQYRHYQPGDDPKRIDWKRFASTGKHLIRESSTESNQQIRFVLDLSGSMNYTEAGVSRLNYAKLILASLAYLGYRQNDLLSLYTLQHGAVQAVVPTGGKGGPSTGFQKILYALQTAQAAGPWVGNTPRFPEFQHKQKELLILASDFLQVGDEWLALIKSLAGPRREIVIFQLLGEQETAFDLRGFYRFQDLETGQEIELQADAVRETFQATATQYLRTLKEALQLPHVRLIRATLSEPVSLVLRQYLTSTS